MTDFRREFPRLYELRDCIEDPESPDAYFQNFEETLRDSGNAYELYLQLEEALQALDETAWRYLKEEARPHLLKRDETRRAWEPLINILNQARAYRYLKSIGCTGLRFVPRERKRRTPDLEGSLPSGRAVLCEVKSINPSMEEIAKRQAPPTIRDLPFRITPEFLKKLRSTIETARDQLDSVDPSGRAVHNIYLHIAFDDFFAECKEAYFEQIDEDWTNAPPAGVELIVHNSYTAYYKPLQMSSALVDNPIPESAGEVAPH